MSPLAQRRLAIANCFLTIGIFAGGLVLVALAIAKGDLSASIGSDVALAPVVVLLAGMGALIVARRPGNLIGISMCLTGLFASLTVLADGYATYTIVTDPGALPAPRIAAWFVAWTWIPTAIPAITLLFLLSLMARR